MFHFMRVTGGSVQIQSRRAIAGFHPMWRVAVLSLLVVWGSSGAHLTLAAPINDQYGIELPARALARLGCLYLRHRADVSAIALSNDGKLIASSGGDALVLVSQLPDGRPVLRLRRDAAFTSSIRFSPDQKLLAWAEALEDENRQRIVVWDLHKARARWTIELARKITTSPLVFSPDGRYLLGGGPDGIIRFWDVSTGAESRRISAHKESVDALGVSPDAKVLCSASRSSATYLWDMRSGQLLRRLGTDSEGAAAVALAPNTAKLVTIGSDSTLREWDMRSGKETYRFPAKTSTGLMPISVSISPDGSWLATGYPYGGIRLWDARTRQPGRAIEDVVWASRDDEIRALAFTPHSRVLVSCRGGGVVHVWDVRTGDAVPATAVHNGRVSWFAFSPDAQRIASAGGDGTLRVWDVPSRAELWKCRPGKPTSAFDGKSSRWPEVAGFSPDNKVLAAQFADATVHLLDAKSGADIKRLSAGHRAEAYSADLRWAAWEDENAVIHILDLGDDHERTIGTVPPPSIGFRLRAAHDLALSGNGQILAAGSGDSVVVYSVSSGDELHTLATKNHALKVDGLAFDAGADVLAVASEFNTSFNRTGSSAYNAAFRLWSIGSGRELFAHSEPARARFSSVALSPDGRIIAVACDGQPTLRLWEIYSAEELQGYGDSGNEACWAAFSPDGEILGSGMQDGTILFWDLSPFDWHAPMADAVRPQQLHGWWADLHGKNAAQAYKAVWSLATIPKLSIPFLKTKFAPNVPFDATLSRLIAQLDADDNRTREAASTALLRRGAAIAPILRTALARAQSEETKGRLTQLLRSMGATPEPAPDADGPVQNADLRASLRSIWVLEKIGTPDARSILQGLTKGDPNARAVREAAAALRRLERKQPAH
jgi:WD40 repeat protein